MGCALACGRLERTLTKQSPGMKRNFLWVGFVAALFFARIAHAESAKTGGVIAALPPSQPPVIWGFPGSGITFPGGPSTNIIVASNIVRIVASVGDPNGDPFKVRLYVDDVIADEFVAASFFGATNAVLNWRNPALGVHRVYVTAFDDRGGAVTTPTANVTVVAAVLKPLAWGTLVVNPRRVEMNSLYSNAIDPEAYATFIFDVPLAGADLEAFLKFDYYGPGIRQELFAFDAPANVSTNILGLPVEFVGAIEVRMQSAFDIDVTPWIRKFAGRRLGIQIRTSADVSFSTRTSWTPSSISMIVTGRATRDVASHLTWPAPPTRVVDSGALTLTVDVADFDGQVDRVLLLDNRTIIASQKFSPTMGPGTYQFSFTVTNLVAGVHSFVFQAVSFTNLASSEVKQVYAASADERPHRWLGSQGNSGSFYVIDAAGRAHVWGRNDAGQLGLGFVSAQGESVKFPVTLAAPGGLKIRQIASAAKYAMALMEDGSLYSWGTNKATPTRYPMPRNTFLFKRIAAADTAGMALDQSGNGMLIQSNGFQVVYGPFSDVKAGTNSFIWRDLAGRVGSVTLPTNALPVLDYAPGGPRSFAVGADLQLYSWRTTLNDMLTRLSIPGVNGWRRVATSPGLTLALDTEGRVWKWGRDFDGTQIDFATPQQQQFPKGITNWLDIAVTSDIAMALGGTGELFAWGRGVPGMWADPLAATAFTPELVRGLPNLLDPDAAATSAAFVSSTMSEGAFVLKIAAGSGSTIEVQSSSDLENWVTFTNVTVESGKAVINAPVKPDAQFFRVAP